MGKQKLISFYKKLIKELHIDFSLLLLRPKYIPSEEAYFKGDVDFLIKKEEFESIFKILYEKCKNEGINFIFIQKFTNKKKFHFFIKDQQSTSITIEFWTAIEFTKNNKLHIFEAENIFESIENKLLSKSEILVLIYITHLYHKQKDVFSQENQYRFKEFFIQLKKNNSTEGEVVFQLLNKIKNEEITLLKANKQAIKLLSKAKIKYKKVVFPVFQLYRKALWNKIFHLHNTIPVVGPDGVGKGIVSEKSLTKLKNRTSFRFKDLYRMRIFYKHIILRFFNPKDLKKNKLDEKLGYYIFIISSLSIYVLPIYLRGKKVLLDRYYLDYYATPIRYLKKEQKPKKLKGYNSILYLTPIPKKMIFMGCKNQSLVERKNELSQTAVDYLQNLYIEFILKKKIPETLFISTENKVEISAKAMKGFCEK